ncbi:ribonuclease P protein component 1 [Halolamina rubra]|uniref:ribonuclease P protein component 1 n=1 Tax=Halolamina rubra TaxID=1380430 RepID=UPI0006789AA3|nr:ribonuclease P protein subunit [Halolamina rubra]
MALTPDTLTRHELNGLPVRVADAANPDLVGISGRVVVETMKTVHVDDGRRVRQVPKEGSRFEFAIGTTDDAVRASVAPAADEAAGAAEASGSVSQLGTETAGVRPGKSGPSAPPRRQGRGASRFDGDSPRTDECQDTVYVTVDGARLLSRPAARTERGGDSTWQSD